jgi:hypothetical protein
MAGILRSSVLGTPLFNSPVWLKLEEFGPIYVPEVFVAKHSSDSHALAPR